MLSYYQTIIVVAKPTHITYGTCDSEDKNKCLYTAGGEGSVVKGICVHHFLGHGDGRKTHGNGSKYIHQSHAEHDPMVYR